MKQLFLFSISIALFINCQDNNPQRSTTNSAEIDIIKTLVKNYEDSYWDNWSTHYSDTAKIYYNSSKFIPPKDIQEYFNRQNAQLAAYKFLKNDVFYKMIIDDKQEKWIYFWAIWNGNLTVNNKLFEVPVHLAVRFVNGKINRENAYYDNIPMMVTLNEIETAKMAEQKDTSK